MAETSPPLTSGFTRGCLILILGAGAFVFVGKMLEPTKPPESPKTAAELAKSEADKKVVEEQAKKDEAAFLKSPGGKLWQKHKDWDRDACITIAKRMVHIGMAAEQVRVSWGRPDHVNTTIFGTHTHEQWVWESKRQYAYFEDGLMTSVQQTK
jgi:hypothetical protein